MLPTDQPTTAQITTAPTTAVIQQNPNITPLQAATPNRGTKRKNVTHDSSEKNKAKKQKDDSEQLRIFSVNTFGFDSDKWENIQKMDQTHNFDMILLQECTNDQETINNIVGANYDAFLTSERPTAIQLDGHTATPSVTTYKSYAAIVKKSSKAYKKVSVKHFTPHTSARVKQHIYDNDSGTSNNAESSSSSSTKPSACSSLSASMNISEPIVTLHRTKPIVSPAASAAAGNNNGGLRRGTRVRKKPINKDRLDSIALRAPQVLEITMNGCMPLAIYNYHAPQGGGSMVGYSGMEARSGHEIVSRAMMDDTTPYKMLIGDQNAKKSSMKDTYDLPAQDLISVAADPLTHIVAPKGLKAAQIDLGQDGLNFKNKGEKGCSDHSPIAVTVNLPKQ